MFLFLNYPRPLLPPPPLLLRLLLLPLLELEEEERDGAEYDGEELLLPLL